jgi:hypothetical protein
MQKQIHLSFASDIRTRANKSINSCKIPSSQTKNFRRHTRSHLQSPFSHLPTSHTSISFWTEIPKRRGNLYSKAWSPTYTSFQNLVVIPFSTFLLTTWENYPTPLSNRQISRHHTEAPAPKSFTSNLVLPTTISPYFAITIFFHNSSPSTRNFHLHLVSKQLFIILRSLIPNPPSFFDLQISDHLTQHNFLLFDSPPHKKLRWIFTTLCQTLAGIFKKKRKKSVLNSTPR